MKKFLIVLLTAAILASILCVSATASTVSDIMDYAHKLDSKNQVPDAIYNMAENILKQVPVSAEQAEAVKAELDELKAAVPAYKGIGAEAYTGKERDAVIESVEDICEILKVTITTEKVAAGDIALHLSYNGREVGVVDFDAIKTTGTSYENAALAIAALVSVAGAAVLLTVGLKKKVYEN